MKDASKKRNLNEKGELLNPKKKTDKGAGVESKKNPNAVRRNQE